MANSLINILEIGVDEMTFWTVAVLALTGQETLSTSVLFTVGHTQNQNILILTFIFITITITQILVFHQLGLKLQTKRERNLIADLSRIYILKVDNFISRWGSKVFLIFLAALLFPPFLTSIIASWLNIPLHTKLYCILLGDCIWYITTWSIVLVTNLLTDNHANLLVNVIIASLIFVIFQRLIANQLMSKWS